MLPQIRKTGSYALPNPTTPPAAIADTDPKLMNARTRMANMYLKLTNVDTVSTEYKNILVAKAAEVLSGKELLPLPKSVQKTYSATEIGDMFGIKAARVGSIANKNGMKTDDKKYGDYYRAIASTSGKEVDTFRYFDSAILRFEEILGMQAALTPTQT